MPTITTGTIKSATDRKITFIASHERLDADGELIKIDGIDLTRFLKNPVLLHQHDWSGAGVARVSNLHRETIDGYKALVGTAEFPEGDEDSERVLRKIKMGLLNGISIGFQSLEHGPPELPHQKGITHLKSLLLEISAVTLPACSTCLVGTKCTCACTGGGEVVLELADEDDTVLDLLGDASTLYDVDPATVRRMTRQVVQDTLLDLARHRTYDVDVDDVQRIGADVVRQGVRELVQDAINRHRGRLV